MQQTKRDLVVPGRIEFGNDRVASIVISELSEVTCRVREDLPDLAAHTRIKVWLGAIGPMEAHLRPSSRSDIEFDGAIHAAIVEHFCSM